MTFEEWLEKKYPKQFLTKYDIKFLKEAWSGGKEAEREKYKELIAAAEAVIYRWDSPLWKDAEPTAAVICKLRCALESLKEEVE